MIPVPDVKTSSRGRSFLFMEGSPTWYSRTQSKVISIGVRPERSNWQPPSLNVTVKGGVSATVKVAASDTTKRNARQKTKTVLIVAVTLFFFFVLLRVSDNWTKVAVISAGNDVRYT